MYIRIYPEKYKDDWIHISEDGRYYHDYTYIKRAGTYWLSCIAGTNTWATLKIDTTSMTNNNDLAHNYVAGLF